MSDSPAQLPTPNPNPPSNEPGWWIIRGRSQLWDAHPQYQGRYEFAVRDPPPNHVDTITTDAVTALVYRQRIMNFVVPWSEPTYYFTHFHYSDANGDKHTVSRQDVVQFFNGLLDVWENIYHLALDLDDSGMKLHSKQAEQQQKENGKEQGSEHDLDLDKLSILHLRLYFLGNQWMDVIGYVSFCLGALSNEEHYGGPLPKWHRSEGPIDLRRPYEYDLKSRIVDKKLVDGVFRMAKAFHAHGLPADPKLRTLFELSEAYCDQIMTHNLVPGWKRWHLVGDKHVVNTLDSN